MTREIKFRIYQNLNAPHEEPDWEVKEYEDIRYEPLCVVEGGLSYHIVRYTGLHDKNGVEIYEGDIVNHTFQFTANQTTGVVAWNIEGLGWYIERCSAGSYPLSNVVNIEVIGNIYEHGHILEDLL